MRHHLCGKSLHRLETELVFHSDEVQGTHQVGDPDLCVTRIKEMQDIGVTYLMGTLNFIPLEHKLCLKSMERFATEVMPHFKEAPHGELLAGVTRRANSRSPSPASTM